MIKVLWIAGSWSSNNSCTVLACACAIFLPSGQGSWPGSWTSSLLGQEDAAPNEHLRTCTSSCCIHCCLFLRLTAAPSHCFQEHGQHRNMEGSLGEHMRKVQVTHFLSPTWGLIRAQHEMTAHGSHTGS